MAVVGGVGYRPDAHDVNMAWHAIDRHAKRAGRP